jgi:hypothetical protein
MPALSTDLRWGARFGLASASFQHVILSEIGTQQSSTPAAGAQEVNAQKINAQRSCTTPKRRTQKGCARAS